MRVALGGAWFAALAFGCGAALGCGAAAGGGDEEPGSGIGVDSGGESDSGGQTEDDGSTDGSAADTADASSGPGPDSDSEDTGPSVPCDDACPEATVCIEDACCPVQSVCQDVCCPDGDVCSFGACETPGADCIDASECADDEYCEYSLGEEAKEPPKDCPGGAALTTGKCLPTPAECPPGFDPDFEAELLCLPTCQVIPTGTFEPEVKAHWAGGDIMMAPLVMQLDDDNCDGIVDERDIPELVFTTFAGGAYNVNGTVRAISIVEGEVVEKWTSFLPADPVRPNTSLAAGNIDGLPGNEVVACSTANALYALAGDGSLLWTSEAGQACALPSIADFDQDGQPEILTPGGVFDGATGATVLDLPNAFSATAADVDGDGFLEIVRNDGVYEFDGTPLSGAPAGHHVAVADFDLDGVAEIVTIDRNSRTAILWRLDPAQAAGYSIVRSGADIDAGAAPCGGAAGGPPTIADFDGDGTPDLGIAAGLAYTVFDGAALMNPAVAAADTIMWSVPATDCSSRNTGSSVFDFEGDGSAEVIYSDERYLRIYNGADGTVLFETCNTTGTLSEYPLVADVDNDGHADIVAVSNAYSSITCPTDGSKQNGLRVFGDTEGNWVRTRRVWNQHDYHVTNVEEDGTIPAIESANWSVEGLNNFRQNVQPEGEFSAPDLIGSVLHSCKAAEFAVIARVRNVGQASVPAGVVVGFYAGDPDAGGAFLGTQVTTKVLYTAEAEDLTQVLVNPPAALTNGEVEAFIIIDDTAVPHAWTECRTDNNRASGYTPCAPEG